MKDLQTFAYAHPQTNAMDALPEEFFRQTQVGPHLMMLGLSVNR